MALSLHGEDAHRSREERPPLFSLNINMYGTYQQYIFLSSLNTWPDDGLPADHIIDFAVSATEGDPRGDVTYHEMYKEYNNARGQGWAEIREVEEGDKNCHRCRGYIFPTLSGRERFLAIKDYWAKKIKVSTRRRENGRNIVLAVNDISSKAKGDCYGGTSNH